ncbi:MAG: GTPase [Candidatus Pacearchaeota archaeon]
MASTNQSPFYQKAEIEYLNATSDEEKMACLEIMIRECPKHKSSENMLSNLKNRLRKLKEDVEKRKSAGKGGQQGIKKTEMQCVLAGFANTGKTTIFNTLTQLKSKTSPHPFTTDKHCLGTFKFEDAKIQIIDMPSFPNHDKSLLNSTDTLLLVIDNLEQIPKSEEFIYRTNAKIILIYNKKDLLSENEKRKVDATLKSKFKKFDFIFFSKSSSSLEILELKKKIFLSFPIVRIYTKEPKKDPTKDPMIMKENSTLKDAIEKIRKGMSQKVRRSRIWGPSSKFGGQVIGLDHILKDKDIIEFKTE